MRVHRPETLDAALALLSELDDVMVYGGGTAIQILNRQRILFTEHYVEIGRIPELREITITDRAVTVGAMVTVRQMETDRRIVDAVPVAAQAYRRVANPRVRNTASVGGNIAHGDYRLDPPTALLTLDATVHLASAAGRRAVPIREFFVGFQETAVEPGEMVVAIEIPRQPANAVGTFVKYSSLSVNDWPCASVAVLAVPDGEYLDMRLGIGALAPTPLYLAYDVERGMSEQDAVEAGIDIAKSAMEPIEDVRGGVDYKLRLGQVAVEDAVRHVMGELAHA